MNHVMLDLETFGSRPGSVIVSIGMVRFGATHLGEEFGVVERSGAEAHQALAGPLARSPF